MEDDSEMSHYYCTCLKLISNTPCTLPLNTEQQDHRWLQVDTELWWWLCLTICCQTEIPDSFDLQHNLCWVCWFALCWWIVFQTLDLKQKHKHLINKKRKWWLLTLSKQTRPLWFREVRNPVLLYYKQSSYRELTSQRVIFIEAPSYCTLFSSLSTLWFRTVPTLDIIHTLHLDLS